jgi:hypothetical protein
VSDRLKDILSGLSKDVDQQKLLEYLQGHLSADQQHDLEEGLLHDDFAAEALEGLQNINDKKKIQQLVAQLNKDLQKKTEKKNAFRKSLELKFEPTALIAVVIVLLLLLISYFILHGMLHK